ncbi:MAG: glycosyltransferase family 2 protein [Leifsonia sp.]|uniref:glycosyltransferase family 2 protein n=1 Tax=Leifsonia sp. TaxID=1870902 RepID=UPI003F813B6F
MTRPVTVVVPVYGDLETLQACVASLIDNVDQSLHRVLLANDSGPEADAIEAALLAQIDGQPGFRYERNPSNLGFVGNCNRAVLELDDTDNDILLLNSDTITTPGFIETLSAALHESENTGAVCPRSNNATVASLPFALRDPAAVRSVERTRQVHAALASALPLFSVSPVAMGFCILIRRELIRRFGLFDEAFAPGYGEENDFCLRIGREGYRSLIVHRAVVYHVGGRSFVGGRREALRSAHEKLLVSRYPDYTDAVTRYLYVDRDPVDVFADCLVPADGPARVLVHLGRRHGGVGESERALLDAAVTWQGAGVTVAGPASALRTVARTHPQLARRRAEHLSGVWDLGLHAGPIGDATVRGRLNRTCLRIAEVDDVSTLDIVRLRTAPVDIPALRERWSAETSRPGYLEDAGAPTEPLHRRVLRSAERTAPRAVGRAKSLARRVLRRPSS